MIMTQILLSYTYICTWYGSYWFIESRFGYKWGGKDTFYKAWRLTWINKKYPFNLKLFFLCFENPSKDFQDGGEHTLHDSSVSNTVHEFKEAGDESSEPGGNSFFDALHEFQDDGDENVERGSSVFDALKQLENGGEVRVSSVYNSIELIRQIFTYRVFQKSVPEPSS